MINYLKLIHCLLEHDLDVLLLPHVLAYADDDRIALRSLYEKLTAEEKQRVFLFENEAAAAEYKYFVEKSSFVICCRTHMSIAAYSTAVPVLALGYSIKAAGIAKDIGMEKYIVQISEIDEETILSERFRDMYRNEAAVRKALQKAMPSYIGRTEAYMDII